mgnify:CR=1 FL=1
MLDVKKGILYLQCCIDYESKHDISLLKWDTRTRIYTLFVII